MKKCAPSFVNFSLMITLFGFSACHGPETECPAINKPNPVVRVTATFKSTEGDLLGNRTVMAYAVVFKKDSEDPVVYESAPSSTDGSTAQASVEFENKENIDESNVDDVVVQFHIQTDESTTLEAVIQKTTADDVRLMIDQVTCGGSASCSYVSYAVPNDDCQYSRGDVYTIPQVKDVFMESQQIDTGGRVRNSKDGGLFARAREAIERYKIERGLN